MTLLHSEIQAFLQRQPELFSIKGEEHIRKAGIVPFLRAPLRYYVMTPIASKPDLGLPEFQLCKGTRMYLADGEWQDMRGDVPTGAKCESLPVTSLREGIEELGLKLSNIDKLFSLGEYHFTSATNRSNVELWMLAAEMKNADDFTAPAASTADRKWMTLAEFTHHGRPDHAHILGLIEKILCA